jgi:ankyrin repeat protein
LIAHQNPENPVIDFVPFLRHFSQGYFSVNWQDEKGRTPLHNAVMRGDYTSVDLLLNSTTTDETIDLNVLDRD